MVPAPTTTPLDRGKCSELLESAETFGSVLLAIAEMTIGTEALWGTDETPPIDPVTLIQVLEDQYGIRIPDQLENKMNALLTCVTTDAFYNDPTAFRMTAMALADGDVGDVFDTLMDDPTLDEIQWAQFEVELWRDAEPEFAPAVVDVVDAVIQQDAEDESESGIDDEPAQMLERLVQFNVQLRHCGITPALIQQLGP